MLPCQFNHSVYGASFCVPKTCGGRVITE
jgi:hypothetical protein